MKHDELVQLIGHEVSTAIIRDRYGDATLHTNGYVTGDPCYMFVDDNDYSLLLKAQWTKYPSESRDYRHHYAEWEPFEFRGHTVYFRDTSDGVGHFGHCVDSGWIVAIPVALVPADVLEKLKAPVSAN